MVTTLPIQPWLPGRAPGVFEARAPRTAPALARLDRAVFIGLAERGPLHTAVDVADWSDFQRQFGRPMASLLLPEAVRLFFEQGGRHCLVVRCLNHEASHTRPLGLPGLDVMPALPTLSAADAPPVLAARNPGGWASKLRLRITVQRQPAPLRQHPGSPTTLLCTPDRVQVGDSLSLKRRRPGGSANAPAPAPLLTRVALLEPIGPAEGMGLREQRVVLDPAPDAEALVQELLAEARRLELTLEIRLAGRLVESWPQAALHPEHPRFLPRLLGRRAAGEAMRPGRISQGGDSESAAAEVDRLWGGPQEPWGSEFVRPSARLLQRSLLPTAALLERGEAWDLPLGDPGESSADRRWRQQADPDGTETFGRVHLFQPTAPPPASDQDDRWRVFADRPGPLDPGGALDRWDEAHPLEPGALIVLPDLLHPGAPEAPVTKPSLPPISRCFGTSCEPPTLDFTEQVGRFPCLAYNSQSLLEAQQLLVRACERRQQGIALLDLPLRLVAGRHEPLRAGERAAWLAGLRSDRAAVYSPWLRVPGQDAAVLIGPAAIAAGLIAASEVELGVWRAPANRTTRSVFALVESVGEELAGDLHQERINAFRSTPAGFTLLGSRTSSADRDWTHLSVRRLIDWLKLQIASELAWAPFEPNDPALWEAMAGIARRRLRMVFEAGGLAGATEEESFFARCDAGTTSPRERENGQAVLLVGVAPALPAEFLVFQLLRRGGDDPGLEVR
jgi:hypothetical protein